MKSELIKMAPVAEEIPGVAEHIAILSASAGLDDQACFEVRVAISEVLNNIVNHALPAVNTEAIEIECQIAEGGFEVTTRDRGKPISIQPTDKFPDGKSECGRGWPILINWMDGIEYQSEAGCNHLTLRRSLDWKPQVVNMAAVAEEIPETTERIANLGAAAGLSDRACFQVRVVMAEVLNNIVNYALPAGNKDTIEIRCQIAEGHFEVTTRDHGKPLEIQPTDKFPDGRCEGGRGWPIIINWMDSIEYQSEAGQNNLTLRMALP